MKVIVFGELLTTVAIISNTANTKACYKFANRRFEKSYISSISNIVWILRMLENLEEGSLSKIIAVMPDFSMNRILTFNSQKQLLDALSEKSKHGGGALRGISATDVRGGNAINIAYCLAKLGAHIKLFTIADEIGSLTLNKIFSKFGDNVNI